MLYMKSVFLTGASGVGKSTTYHMMLSEGFELSPYHITRPPRTGEIDGRDAHFINEQTFLENVANGEYLEASGEEAFYAGVYYGSPRVWIDEISSQEKSIIAMPANALVVSALCKELENLRVRDQLLWVNLYAPIETRKSRIETRVHDPEVLRRRLSTGVTQGILQSADVNIDTSVFSPDEVVNIITDKA